MTNSFKTYIFYLLTLFFIITSCSSDPNRTTISGTIDYTGNAELFLEMIPLHYKYSQKKRIPVTPENNTFSVTFAIENPQIVYFVIQDATYPLYVEPGNKHGVTISRSDFPSTVLVEGPGSTVNSAYENFLSELGDLPLRITAEMEKYKNGEPNTALSLSTQKVALAEQYFKQTSFHDLYLKAIGEDLVLQLRGVEYSARHQSSFNADSARTAVLTLADSLNFFSLESLTAQRAGIRDFTHYYSRTFSIYDSVVQSYQMNLAEYDIKRVAYEALNKRRLEVLDYVKEEDALAYAELFLVAERIGEQPIDIAEPTYNDYMRRFGLYPQYTDFLTNFFQELKSVSPGEEAIPFSLYDDSGELHSMSDYTGKFVLLDIWAGWCQPCLEEFPHMREIYADYSRDELEILGISTEVDSLLWRQDIRRFENPWPQLYGGNGFDNELFKAYKGGGIPFYVLIDPDGKIIRYNDLRPSFNFTEVLDSLLVNYSIQ